MKDKQTEHLLTLTKIVEDLIKKVEFQQEEIESIKIKVRTVENNLFN